MSKSLPRVVIGVITIAALRSIRVPDGASARVARVVGFAGFLRRAAVGTRDDQRNGAARAVVHWLKLSFVGPGRTVKLAGLAAVPLGVMTVIGPLEALVGTMAVIRVGFSTTKLVGGGARRNCTAVAPVKFVPVSVTVTPAPPLPGAKATIVGALLNVPMLKLIAAGVAVETVHGDVIGRPGGGCERHAACHEACRCRRRWPLRLTR